MRTVFFDLETGGLKVGDPIIQFAGVAVDEAFKELEVLELKIKVNERDCQPAALRVNGYTPERWKDAVPCGTAMMKICEFFERHADVQLKGKNPPFRPYTVAQVGGHNVSGFDIERLAFTCKANGQFLPIQFNSALDTLHGAIWYFRLRPHLPRPASFNLLALTQYFDLEHGEAHEALADVRMSIELAKVFLSPRHAQ